MSYDSNEIYKRGIGLRKEKVLFKLRLVEPTLSISFSYYRNFFIFQIIKINLSNTYS